MFQESWCGGVRRVRGGSARGSGVHGAAGPAAGGRRHHGGIGGVWPNGSAPLGAPSPAAPAAGPPASEAPERAPPTPKELCRQTYTLRHILRGHCEYFYTWSISIYWRVFVWVKKLNINTIQNVQNLKKSRQGNMYRVSLLRSVTLQRLLILCERFILIYFQNNFQGNINIL